MSSGLPVLAYVGAVLPKRSETFVYREVLGLRKRGHAVVAVSLRAASPEEFDDDAALAALAREALVVYRAGFVRRGLVEALRHPLRAARAKWRLFTAAVESGDLDFRGWGKLPAQYLAGLAMAHELRSRNIQHLHAHMAHAPTTVAMVAADQLGIPFSFTGHAADLFRDRSLLKVKLRRAAFVACISEWHRRWYREIDATLDEAKLPVIRCGVDLAEFSAGGGEPTDGVRGPVVLGVGRLVPKKGFDVLLRAWAGWLEERGFLGGRDEPTADNVCAKTVGEPLERSTAQASDPMCVMMGDGPEAVPLAALAAELGIGAFVQFTGKANQEQVRRAMRGCDVFALPCREASDGDRDGIPVVLMEAMACEKPVIGGDLEGIGELLSDNSGARVVKPGDVGMLKAALGEFLSSAELRADAGRRGRARVAEEFSADVNLERLERAFAAGVSRGSERDEEHG